MPAMILSTMESFGILRGIVIAKSHHGHLAGWLILSWRNRWIAGAVFGFADDETSPRFDLILKRWQESYVTHEKSRVRIEDGRQ